MESDRLKPVLKPPVSRCLTTRPVRTHCRMRSLLLLLILLGPVLAHASGKILTVEYPPSTQPGELIFKSVYRLWIPDDVTKLRAVIVHQHGCGVGSWKSGITAADD